MQDRTEGYVTILSEADEDAISSKLTELMELIWDTFQRRRIVLRTPQCRGKHLQSSTATDLSAVQSIF